MTPTGADVLLEVLRSEGVTHVFGNPGTTELPLTEALAEVEDISYVLSLQEASAAAMADGYAQASGRPAFLNLHTSVGLGNAAGSLTNAQANRTPLVVTAGQQDERHLAADPFLAGNLVEMARPLTKWAHEVRSPDELGTMLRRAFRDAQAPPSGPVFLALRMDHLGRPAAPAPPRATVRHGSTAESLDELAELLCGVEPGEAALVLGEEVAQAGALEAVVGCAEAIGAAVFGAPLFGSTVFPAAHPLWRGMLPLTSEEIEAALAPYRVVFAIGADPFQPTLYTPADPLAPETTLLQLAADPLTVGRALPVRLGVSGDVRASLAALAPLLSARADADAVARVLAAARERRAEEVAAWERRAQEGREQVPIDPVAAARALMSALPPETPLVNEAPSTGAYARIFHRAEQPRRYHFARGGGLGWAMPAACGVALALPGQPVACVLGDGATMYSPQALWTAAHHRLPVLFAVMDNRGYAILRDTLEGWQGPSARTGTFVATELDDPPLDFLALAASMGVAATSLGSTAELTEVAATAAASGLPHLLHIPIPAPQDAGDE
jgi:benzoylformate decarboxylase